LNTFSDTGVSLGGSAAAHAVSDATRHATVARFHTLGIKGFLIVDEAELATNTVNNCL
jgi:hypothetical protein